MPGRFLGQGIQRETQPVFALREVTVYTGESNVTKIRTLKRGVQKRKDQFYIRKEAGSARASWQR